jgi:hypothetical protein
LLGRGSVQLGGNLDPRLEVDRVVLGVGKKIVTDASSRRGEPLAKMLRVDVLAAQYLRAGD